MEPYWLLKGSKNYKNRPLKVTDKERIHIFIAQLVYIFAIVWSLVRLILRR